MRINCIFLLGCLITASCTTKLTVGNTTSTTNDIEEPTSKLYRNTPKHNIKDAVIKYDKTLPIVPEISVIQNATNYDKEDKYTFPIYGDETTVAPPANSNSSLKKVAIWCTKECTVVANLIQMLWDTHYFQRTSGDYIEDVQTGKRYYVKGTYDGFPMDMSYNIKGVSGEWICCLDVYPPLPEECTVINIIGQNVTDDVKNGAAWSGALRIRNVPVSLLQRNQSIVKFQKTKIIE